MLISIASRETDRTPILLLMLANTTRKYGLCFKLSTILLPSSSTIIFQDFGTSNTKRSKDAKWWIYTVLEPKNYHIENS